VNNPREASDTEVLLALNRSATAARLLSGVIHEINNALQVISGTVELLEARNDMPAATKTSLERLRNQSARAAATLSEVLLFTRAPIRDTAIVNMHDVAQHSANLRMFAIRRAGLQITLTAGEGDFRVTGNRGQLQQAVLNLIANSEQALAPQRKGSIHVQVDGDATHVTLRVSDDGPGIDMSPMEAAFEPFVTSRDPWEGAGLGLWAAREIATAHAGTLTLEEGTKSTFVMRLPRAT
jgi:signal transduction histidine kinase